MLSIKLIVSPKKMEYSFSICHSLYYNDQKLPLNQSGSSPQPPPNALYFRQLFWSVEVGSLSTVWNIELGELVPDSGEDILL